MSFTRLHHFSSTLTPAAFSIYQSPRSGLRVIVVNRQSAQVTGVFTLATEIHDDSGAPHTLEHLCFLGSRNHRYKGFLDQLSTRVYSETNAVTDTDNTSYSLESAGWPAFRTILPIYLDHLLAPTLTDEAFHTEVYHVDGAGKDAGVVLSEMQDHENDATLLIDRCAKRLLYPENCGYRYTTGGLPENLRVLTPDRVREFHKQMYHPGNLCLIITGQVNEGELLEVLDGFEQENADIIEGSRPVNDIERPFAKNQPAPLQESAIESVRFPEDDESVGMVEIRYLGPNINNREEMTILSIALHYLAGSSASPLVNALVAKEQRCGEVYYSFQERPHTEISFSLTGVETEELESVERRFFEVLHETLTKPFDMGFMRDCRTSLRREVIESAEGSLSSFELSIISDYIYGARDGSTLEPSVRLERFDAAQKLSEADWKAFIKKWLCDANHVSVLAIPSKERVKEVARETEELVEKRRQALGEEGLQKMQNRLEDAMKANSKPVPRNSLTKFDIPDPKTIPWIKTTMARFGSAIGDFGRPDNAIQKRIDSDGEGVPETCSDAFFHFEHIPSQFAEITLSISTQNVPEELRPLLPLYIQSFFELPLSRDGKTIPFESVVIELDRELADYSMRCYYTATTHDLITITMKAEREKYADAIRLLNELTWNTIFDKDRLKSIASQMLAESTELKRDACDMLHSIKTLVQQTPQTSTRACSTLIQSRFLRKAKKSLAAAPDEFIGQLQNLRQSLFRPENIRICIISDIEKLTAPVSTWTMYLTTLRQKSPSSNRLLPLLKIRDRLTPQAQNPGQKGDSPSSFIVPMPTTDSSFLTAVTKGPTSFTDPAQVAIKLATAFLNAPEGPLWTASRSTGLAYGLSITSSCASGQVSLEVYRSPHAHRALAAAKRVVEGYANADENGDTTPIDADLALPASVSSIVSNFAYDHATIATAAQASFQDAVIKDVPAGGYHAWLLEQAKRLTVADLRAALRAHVLPLFSGETAEVFAVCPASESAREELVGGLGEMGFRPDVRPLKHFEGDFNAIPEEDGDGDDDSDESEEEEDDDDDDDEDEDERGD